MDFGELIKIRRSVTNFIEGVQISDEELNRIFELVKYSPSCYNLQHIFYIVIRDNERKKRIKEIAFNQHKVVTSSAVIIVCGNLNAYKDAENIYNGMRILKMIDNDEYNQIIQTIYNLYEGRGEQFRRDEAIRNASLSAMSFMYAAEYYGYNTCPMIGFDSEELIKELNLSKDLVPVLMITIGKADKNKMRLRGYRKPINEFVRYEK